MLVRHRAKNPTSVELSRGNLDEGIDQRVRAFGCENFVVSEWILNCCASKKAIQGNFLPSVAVLELNGIVPATPLRIRALVVVLVEV